MPVGPQTQQVIDSLNTATNAVAARITQILSQMDLTAEEQAAFDAVIANLNALASDPNNPAPPLPPA